VEHGGVIKWQTKKEAKENQEKKETRYEAVPENCPSTYVLWGLPLFPIPHPEDLKNENAAVVK
jgi:hypothetical protein